ncbi:hypothetical protein NQ318_022245 [Aromia moschata]|uniref:Uncharacterized protein n=1 Tax=Aromia moschata TaxID=1265417 RepID=A0AAV8X9D5_9CUCU|nr:hypothetical protein NQ318_022245 [Aromia moschata]
MEQLLKDHELPLKKQKLNEYLNNINHIPYNMQQASCIQQIYESRPPLHPPMPAGVFRRQPAYIRVQARRAEHKGVEDKARQRARHHQVRHRPPVLQNPERVVLMSESERFERTYQPNVALAPPTLKKHRYGRACESTPTTTITAIKSEPLSPVKSETVVKEEVVERKSPEKALESAVSVVQSTSTATLKYNPEIELSTDTEDSASETSEKHPEFVKIEEVLKEVDGVVKDKILEMFKALTKEHDRVVHEGRMKDNKISDLELRNSELQKELDGLRARREEEPPPPPPPEALVNGGDDLECKDNTSSSIIVANEGSAAGDQKPAAAEPQKTVIASLEEQKEAAIVKAAPE